MDLSFSLSIPAVAARRAQQSGADQFLANEDFGVAIDFGSQSALVKRASAAETLLLHETSGVAIDFGDQSAIVKE